MKKAFAVNIKRGGNFTVIAARCVNEKILAGVKRYILCGEDRGGQHNCRRYAANEFFKQIYHRRMLFLAFCCRKRVLHKHCYCHRTHAAGTGVMAEALSLTASKSTSPQSLPFSRFIPTSITTAPAFTISAVTNRGLPTAATGYPPCGRYPLGFRFSNDKP